jgi:hypothetical protein
MKQMRKPVVCAYQLTPYIYIFFGSLTRASYVFFLIFVKCVEKKAFKLKCIYFGISFDIMAKKMQM